MYPSVKTVAPLDNYLLAVSFDNGEKGILDLKPYLDFGVFKRLQDVAVFNRVRVSFDTIEWDAGVDLAPEFVYSKSQRSTAEKVTTVTA
ncbi:MAG: DUF2442 domain-containing protein [Gammaproteobacteria bacterium]|nr:DUF2442 domain-containing protein [Gammaproteobacteria bacterium]